MIDCVRYLLACSRYIELNPVRAGMVGSPGEYRWSSFHCNALGAEDPVVTVHPRIAELGPTNDLRRAAYLALFDVPLDEDTIAAIRATRRSRARGRETGPRGSVGVPPDATHPEEPLEPLVSLPVA